MKKFKALIIGAGNIGAFFDKPKSQDVLTHAHAYKRHPRFNLVGFIDIDPKKAEKAAKIWHTNNYKTIDEAFSKENNIDIVSVCVPDELHYQIIKQLIKKPVKLIFTEKPITKSLNQAKDIINLCKDKQISLLVNYTRRFVPEIIKLKEDIQGGVYGKFICGNSYYGKGIIHNGSHLIDLIRYLISDITAVSTITKQYDFYKDDPSLSTILKINNNINIFMLNINCKFYTIFELDLFFEKARIRIIDSGNMIEKYKTLKSKTFKGYKYLSISDKVKTSLNKSIYFAVNNIYNHLEKGQYLSCNGNEAYKNLETATIIKQDK
jgi:predicted dehydrogenase